MKLWTRAMIFGAGTEAFFALCTIFGEEIDTDLGDLAGLVSLIGHLPVAVGAWLIGFESPGSLPWIIFWGFVVWTVLWWIPFALILSREKQLSRGYSST